MITNDTPQDLLQIAGGKLPLGDLGFRELWGRTRSVWAPGTNGHPRIMHEQCLQSPGPVRLDELRISPANGLHKCGSGDFIDRVTGLRLMIRRQGSWETVVDETTPVRSSIDLGGVRADAAIIGVTSSALDGDWTPWNLSESAFTLYGSTEGTRIEPAVRRLTTASASIEGLPAGVRATLEAGAVRYETERYRVGFALGRPGFTSLELRDEQGSSGNLLARDPARWEQGVHIAPIGKQAIADATLRFAVEGTTVVRGNTIRYEFADAEGLVQTRIEWTALPDCMTMTLEQEVADDLECWEAASWRTVFDARAAATTTLGCLTREGRTGRLPLPVTLHVPGHGNWLLTTSSPVATWRSDAIRQRGLLIGELSLGVEDTPWGTHVLGRGRHSAKVIWEAQPSSHVIRSTADASDSVSRAIAASSLTALTFRPDTGTLSNNSLSIHCPMSMDTWARTTLALQKHAPSHIDPARLLRYSLERWLDGGPGYGSGAYVMDGKPAQAEDDYLITGAATLLGLAEFLAARPDAAWFASYEENIDRALDATALRDLDGDGLIESRRRAGVFGSGQWSTDWYDVVSIGWKDAWVNALLYRALVLMSKCLTVLDRPHRAAELEKWSRRLQDSFRACFSPDSTGWVPAWRSSEGETYNFRFPAINGAVVASGVLDKETTRSVMSTVWRDLKADGPADLSWGLPVTLDPIPDGNLVVLMRGLPHGFYLNGALSHSQSRWVVDGLDAAGMHAEADELREVLSVRIASAEAFGGVGSGVDWRFWDGAPCGYEGLLTEQFGIIGPLVERFAVVETDVPPTGFEPVLERV